MNLRRIASRGHVSDPHGASFDGIFPQTGARPCCHHRDDLFGRRQRPVHRRQGHPRRTVPRASGRHDAAGDGGRHGGRVDPAGDRQLAQPARDRARHIRAGGLRRSARRSCSARGCCSSRRRAWRRRLVYLQISGLGPMLGSGFWLIATERFDPHTARLHFGRIAGVGTLAGLGGALVAERIGARSASTAMLPLLAALNLVCAWQVRRLAGPKVLTIHDKAHGRRTGPRRHITSLGSARAGGAPYLRNLAALVLLGTVARRLPTTSSRRRRSRCSAAATRCCDSSPSTTPASACWRSSCRACRAPLVLERLGLAADRGTPSLALVARRLGALVFPGLGGALVARAGESSFRSSLFRTGYEIFYTPIAVARQTRGQVDHRRRLRSPRRRRRWRPDPTADPVAAAHRSTWR